jgi:hypothetical protein
MLIGLVTLVIMDKHEISKLIQFLRALARLKVHKNKTAFDFGLNKRVAIDFHQIVYRKLWKA